MTQRRLDSIRAETLLLLEAEEDNARWIAYERFLNGIADTIIAKADVVPVWAAVGLYETALRLGEDIILKGIYREV